MSEWYLKRAGAVSGPFSMDELKYLQDRGRLGVDDQLRAGKKGDWLPAGRMDSLFPPQDAPPNADGQQKRSPLTAGGAAATAAGATTAAAATAATMAAPRRGGAAAGVQGGSPLSPAALPTDEEERRKRRRLIFLGVAIGTGLALLLLLLLLLLKPPHKPEIAGGGSRTGDSSGTGTGSGQGDGAGSHGRRTGSGQDANATSNVGGGQTNADGGGTSAVSESDPTKQQTPADKTAGEDGSATETEDSDQLDEAATAGEIPQEEVDEDPNLFAIVGLEETHQPRPDTGGRSRLEGRGGSGRRVTSGMFAGRSRTSRLRNAIREGGSRESEQAVNRGLEWLVKHQCDDGHWSLNAYHQVGDCNGQCGGPVRGQSDIAGTALGVLPFLGAGETHRDRDGKYRDEVKGALDWLISHQGPNGALLDNGRMYEHGLALIALSEAYAMTHDEQLKEPAQRAVDLTVRAQTNQGGWRYTPNPNDNDLSVTGWHVMGLQSARCAGLDVPEDVFKKIEDYLGRVQVDVIGSRYGYTGPSVSISMTSVGLLCRQYLGRRRENPGMQQGVAFLLENLPNKQNPHMYYWYYGTQVLHHYGGPEWKEQWNPAMRDLLIEMQETEGHLKGSWPPVGGSAPYAGRVYMTALAICNLEVYYRHMPLYREPD